jgi:hypothetical protein
MTKDQAIRYLCASGFSDAQVKAVSDAFKPKWISTQYTPQSGRQYLCRDTNGFREVGYLVKPGEWKFNTGAYMEEVIAWTELPGSDEEIIV